jgi:putative molybdopterin biosynthesis protein
LWAQVQHLHPEAHFVPSYVGSLDGLLALLHRETGVAGTHILDEETGEYNLPILRRLFVAGGLCVVTLAERVQGVMVAPGNPLRITSVADLARAGVRFVNRQPGSGTRALLDYNLRRLDLEPARIAGYDRVVTTHMAVAAAVTDGTADAGLGVLAAARAFGLDFVPVAKERYDLVLWAQDRTSPPLSWLLGALRSEEFRAVVGAMGGYDTTHTGEESLL